MHTRYASLVKKMLTELLACEVDLLLKKDVHVHNHMQSYTFHYYSVSIIGIFLSNVVNKKDVQISITIMSCNLNNLLVLSAVTIS